KINVAAVATKATVETIDATSMTRYHGRDRSVGGASGMFSSRTVAVSCSTAMGVPLQQAPPEEEQLVAARDQDGVGDHRRADDRPVGRSVREAEVVRPRCVAGTTLGVVLSG